MDIIKLISENLATLLVSALLIAVVILVLFYMKKEKKKGGCGCGCGCSGCPMSDGCAYRPSREPKPSGARAEDNASDKAQKRAEK